MPLNNGAVCGLQTLRSEVDACTFDKYVVVEA